MTIKTIINSLKHLYINSQKMFHCVAIGLSLFIFAILKYFNVIVPIERMTLALTGLSIIVSFFLITLQNIDFAYINKNFNNMIKIGRKRKNHESVQIRSTIFSMSLNTVTLLGLCFIFVLFDVNFLLFLVMLICYLFVGIIYTIILWNYFASVK
ncbi:MAG: hypothetical protein FWG65_13040 [Turicibacter sp.]|nr:hypothetical protein [Turicibacter sp.]